MTKGLSDREYWQSLLRERFGLEEKNLVGIARLFDSYLTPILQ